MADNPTPDSVDVEIGNRIRIRRKWLKLSQASLADALGLTFQQVQKYERGANRVSASMLVRIAARLETTVAALVGETEDQKLDTPIYRALALNGAIPLLEAYLRMPTDCRAAYLHLAMRIAPPALSESLQPTVRGG